ncbi:phage antirepressor [Nocardiopsis alba]|uniref:phage antirepressor n=1 Tax=Nocardiopsis alba TaxID=53437 RepID=UPI0036CFA702
MSLQPFTFPDTGQQVRTIMRDAEVWFVAVDVCAVLGLAQPHRSLAALDDDEKGRHSMTTPGGEQRVSIISEPGLYSLVLRSRKAEAKAFRRWITHDVLPALRTTGRYEIAQAAPALPAVPQTYAAALRAAADAVEAREIAQAELAEAQPKADSWDILASGVGDLSVADAAKILTRDPAIVIGRDRLFDQMATDGWVYRARSDGRWRAYQSQVNNGRLSELPQTYTHPKTQEVSVGAPQLRITLKGLHELHRRLGGIRQLQIPSEGTR